MTSLNDELTEIANHDLITVARLNVTRADSIGTTAPMTDYLLRLGHAQATIAAATEARLANRLKWIELFPHTRLAQQYRTEIEDAL